MRLRKLVSTPGVPLIPASTCRGQCVHDLGGVMRDEVLSSGSCLFAVDTDPSQRSLTLVAGFLPYSLHRLLRMKTPRAKVEAL